jgi:3-hydroxyphenylacetate 6-hydroxylase
MAIIDLLHSAARNAIDYPLQSFAFLIIAIPILYIISNEFVRKNARVAGLGGPTGLPLIGNLWEIRINAAEKYRQWAKKYGAVYQIQLGNIPVVVVNSAASAKVLFGQNAQALSSRPEFYTFHKVSHQIPEKSWQLTRNWCYQIQPEPLSALRHIAIPSNVDGRALLLP